MTGDESAAGVEPTLRSYGISVESLDGGEPLELTYMTAFPGREVHRREIGRALNALIDRAEAGAWEPARVEATVVRSTDDVLGRWTAEADWFDALIEDELSETEFSTRVLGTVTRADESNAADPVAADPDDANPDGTEPDDAESDDAGGTGA